MNSEEINEMFEAFEKSNNKKLLELAEIEVNDDKIEEYTRNNSNEILSRLMAKIENGDYSFFLESRKEERKKIFYKELMMYSTLMKNFRNVIFNEFEIAESGLTKLDFLELIEDKQRRIVAGIYDSQYIVKLVEETENYEYIKSLIDDREKRKRVGLDNNSAIDLIIFLYDIEYTKKVLDNKEIIEDFGIDRDSILRLIECINSKDFIEYIESILNNKQKCEEIGLTDYDVYYLKNELEKVRGTIAWIEDDKITKDSVGYDKYSIIKLIKNIRDSNYVKLNILENEKKRNHLGLTREDILRIIADMKDLEYIKSIIENPELLKKIGLESSDVLILMELLDEPDYIKSILEDEEQIKKIGLNQNVLRAIEDCYICNEIPSRYTEIKKSIEIRDRIKLPSNMKKGIEIESEGQHSGLIRLKMNSMNTRWIAVKEDTLKHGLEIKSPTPKDNADNEKDEYEIKLTCGMLKELGQTTSSRCGAHVHIGADYLTTMESWINLLEIWGNTEGIVYLISNKEGELPRSGVEEFAKSFSGELEKALKNGSVDLKDEEELKKFAKEIQGDRGYSINFKNLGSDKNTIEFRLSNGTIDAKTWIENINLYGGIVKAAEEIAQIQLKNEKERTEEEIEKLKRFELLKSKEISYEEKLEALLFITVDKENIDIYKKRFEINRELMIKYGKEYSKIIQEQLAKGSIDVRSKTEKYKNSEGDGER